MNKVAFFITILFAFRTFSNEVTAVGAEGVSTNVTPREGITIVAKSLGAIPTVTNAHFAATHSRVVLITITTLCQW